MMFLLLLPVVPPPRMLVTACKLSSVSAMKRRYFNSLTYLQLEVVGISHACYLKIILSLINSL
jgi:hypothetical protein